MRRPNVSAYSFFGIAHIGLEIGGISWDACILQHSKNPVLCHYSLLLILDEDCCDLAMALESWYIYMVFSLEALDEARNRTAHFSFTGNFRVSRSLTFFGVIFFLDLLRVIAGSCVICKLRTMWSSQSAYIGWL